MKLLKGAILDIPEKNAPANSWRYAMNMVLKGGVLQTEKGVEVKTSFLSFLPIGDCLLPDNSMLFFTTDGLGENKIYRWKDNILSVTTSFYFGFDKNHPIVAESKYTNDLDIEVVFTDNYLRPRFITIDKDSGTIQEDTIEDTLLFPKIRVPTFDLQEVGGGGNLSKGSYQITLGYKFLDGGYTNYINLSNPIMIKSNGGSFRIKIENIDETFDEFRIGIIANNDSVFSAQRTLNDFSITGDEKIISIIGGAVQIPVEDILIKSLTYNRIGDFTVIDNSLYATNLSRDVAFDFQSYANDIKIEPVNTKTVALDTIEGSYADPLVTFGSKGFANQEIYSFYIGTRGMDGLPIAAFPIPMTQGLSDMDLHTNQNENYPTDKDYPETGGIGDPVRHHKFPKANPADFLETPSTGAAPEAAGGTPSLVDDYDSGGNHAVKFGSTAGSYGAFLNDWEFPALTNTMWYDDAGTPVSKTLNVTGTFKVQAGSGATGGGYMILRCEILTATNDFIENVFITSKTFVASELVDLIGDGSANMGPTDRLRIECIIFTGDAVGNFTLQDSTFHLIEAESGYQAGAKYHTHPTGIKLSNIVIPQGILDKVQSFEILYARRTNANSSVIAQGIIYPRAWAGSTIGDRARIHDFGLLLDKPNVSPNKIIGQYELQETDGIMTYSYLGNTPNNNTQELDIVSSKYIPHDNSAAYNDEGEEHFQVTPGTSHTPTADWRLLANLVNDRDDYYLSFDTQVLISTGKQFIIPTDTDNPPAGWVWNVNKWEVTIDELYGGDTYTILNKIRLTRSVKEDQKTDITLQTASIKTAEIPVQTKYNSTLRTWSEDVWYEKEPNFTPPRLVQVAAGYHHTVNSDNNINESTALSYDHTKEYTTHHEFDRGYLNENDKVQMNIQADELNEYPHRTIRTIEQNKESEISSWRQFKPLDYYEQNKDRGEIVCINTFDTDKLIIHHERGLFITAGKEKLATNVTEIIIGSGDIFDRDPKEPIYSEEGFLGTSHKFFNKTTPLGYIFESDNRIFLLGKQLEEITKKGVRFHFNELLNGVGDNPYIQDETDPAFVGGMSASYDKLHERLLVNVNKINSSETWSYAKDIGAWVGKHSETNNKFIDTSTELYAISNKQLFVHNADNVCKSYDGIAKEAYIVLSFSQPEDMTKLHGNVMWNTTVENGQAFPDETFQKIRVWDSRQDSGDVDLVNHTSVLVDHNLRRTHNIWRYNKLRMVGDQYADRKKFIDDYLTVKLMYDTTEQKNLLVSDIEVTKRLTII